MEFEKCRDVLMRESELVQKISSLQDMVYKAVVGRDWANFDEHFKALENMGKELAVLENERERVFSECYNGIATDADASSRFYSSVARFSQEQRNEITEIYRSLKMETIRVQTASETLTSYIAGMRSTVAEFFKTAFPERSGKTYSPYGTQVSHDMRSMVLNQQF